MSVIPKEQIAAYERWQANSFDDAASDDTPVAAPSGGEQSDGEGELVSGVKFPTAEELERVQTDAHQEGYDAGFAKGLDEGREAGLADARLQAEQIATLTENFHLALAQLDQNVADAVLALALETARQVVRSAIRTQPDLILPVIREAISSLPLHHGNIVLHLNASDAGFLRAQLGEQLAQSGWNLIDDAAIEPGGCLLKAGASEVDATLATRWQRVLESIGAPQTPAPESDAAPE